MALYPKKLAEAVARICRDWKHYSHIKPRPCTLEEQRDKQAYLQSLDK